MKKIALPLAIGVGLLALLLASPTELPPITASQKKSRRVVFFKAG